MASRFLHVGLLLCERYRVVAKRLCCCGCVCGALDVVVMKVLLMFLVVLLFLESHLSTSD